jgi:hypothetical protein
MRRHWPWVVVLVAVIAAIVLHDTARHIAIVVAFLLFLAACIASAGASVRDNDVTSDGIRGPAERVLAMMGADTRGAARRRRRDRESGR